MSQQNIDFGTFPDDPSADAIRTAFQKVQDNFDEVYASTANAAVLSVNRTAGRGISVNSPTGNVIVEANVASLSISSVTLRVGTSPNPVTNSAIYTNYSQTLYVEIPNTLSISNLITSGNISAGGNLTSLNASLGNAVVANYFVGDGSQISNITASASNIANVAGTVSQNAQSNITSLGTLTSLSVSGNITAGNIYANAGIIGAQYFTGDGSNLANIQVANVSGTIANANYASYAGDVINSSQSNITTVGSLASLSVVGNANVGNIGATNGVFTSISGEGGNLSNITGANVSGFVPNANIANTAFAVAGANVSGTVSSATTAGTITTNAQPNITSTGTLTSLSVSGNANIGNVGTSIITATGTITGGNLATAGNLSVGGNTTLGNLSVTGILNAGDITVGSISNGTSIVDIIGVSGNVTTTVAGVANVLVITTTGANIDGTLSVSGNITAGNISATTFTGNLTGNATRATTAGTLTTNAQPNITSLGTLTSLSVSGNSNLGNVGNVKITGSAGYLQNDGSGNLSFVTVITQVIPGTANSILLSSGLNGIDASGNIKFNDPQLDIIGNLSVTGNANVGNIGATNIVGTLTTNAQPNITSVGTLAGLTLNANLNSNSNIVLNNVNANISTLGNMTANVYFGNGSQLTGVTAATAGTVTTAAQPNITSTGTLTSLAVTGNISAGNMSATTFTGALTGLASSATVAASANSVALANVVGVGNIASINKDGNASNILYGNGIFASTPTMYANINVATFLASYGSNTITTTGNVNVGNIIGNGQALTGLAGANVSGAVTYATTANSVAGANVSGQVGNALVAGTVYTNAQTNITSVGTLTSLSVSGNITGANIIATSYHIRSVGTGISAAGSSQGTGTALTKEINIVSTVSSGANGVVLPTAVVGMMITITNTTANSLLVYPASSGAINSLGTNVAFTQGTTTIQFIAPTSTQWYTVGATYA
jgi:hypothetical protein